MTDDQYGREYFARYEETGRWFRRGERPWLYAWWRRRLGRLVPQGRGGGRPRLLEVACGGGYALSAFRDRFAVMGLDLARAGLAVARHRLGSAVPLVQGSALALPVANASMDVLVAFDVLEHLDQPSRALTEFRRVLRPGGILAVTVPNPRSLGMRVKQQTWFGARQPPAPMRDDTHVNVWPRERWEAAFREAHLEVEAAGTDGLWDAPYVRGVPALVQRLVFNYPAVVVAWGVGKLPWSLGENLVFVVRRP